MTITWRTATRALRADLGAAGMDLVAPLQVGWYNARVQRAHALDDQGHPGRLALVVGNTRAIWDLFVAALGRDPALLAAPHPLEQYVEAEVTRAVAALGLPALVRFVHQPPLFSVQTLALAAGLAARSPVHLCAHPVHGTWFGLRAAVVVDLRGPQQPPPDPGPCEGCSGPCVAPFQQALEKLGTVTRYHETVERPDSEAYHRWVAFRDACPVGPDSRYREPQIRYHYTRDREVLRGEAERITREARTAVTRERLRQAWTFEDLPGCPGRAVLRRAPRFLTPADLVGTGVQLQGFAVDEAADAVLVAHLEGGGGLISYLGKNGTYTHTLNTEEGLVRKLAQLGLRAEG